MNKKHYHHWVFSTIMKTPELNAEIYRCKCGNEKHIAFIYDYFEIVFYKKAFAGIEKIYSKKINLKSIILR